ncbi:MAG: IBR domain-containing protein [Blastocatellia bacterium]|nr:IBR domain-containing protein [Blastocatellia bacterium]
MDFRYGFRHVRNCPNPDCGMPVRVKSFAPKCTNCGHEFTLGKPPELLFNRPETESGRNLRLNLLIDKWTRTPLDPLTGKPVPGAVPPVKKITLSQWYQTKGVPLLWFAAKGLVLAVVAIIFLGGAIWWDKYSHDLQMEAAAQRIKEKEARQKTEVELPGEAIAQNTRNLTATIKEVDKVSGQELEETNRKNASDLSTFMSWGVPIVICIIILLVGFGVGTAFGVDWSYQLYRLKQSLR